MALALTIFLCVLGAGVGLLIVAVLFFFSALTLAGWLPSLAARARDDQ